MLNDKYASPRSRAGSLATRNAEPRPSNAMRSSPLSQAMQLPSANYEKGKLGGIFTGMSGPKNAGTSDRTPVSISIQSPNPAMNATQSTLTSIDIHKFSDDYFEVETYIRGVLQQLPSEDAIQQLHNSLTDAKDLAASDLQRNVFRNYNDFVIISKEISKLEGDMLHLRGILTDLKDVQDNLRPETDIIDTDHTSQVMDDPLASSEQKLAAAAEAQAKLRAREEELAESREAQMKTLYSNIDGLQKILPELKGRYLVRDGSKTHYWEVSPTTFKQKDMVHLYLFNDMLVVVSWKKNIITGKSRMFAEMSWGLSDIGFIDMKDSPDVSNAFKIVRHPDVDIYRSETLEEKRAILASIKRITDDILMQRRKEKDQSKDIANTKSTMNVISQGSIEREESTRSKDQSLLKDNLSMTDYRWLLELPDELDVLVAHRDFDNAVTNLEKARKILLGIDVETPRVQMLRASAEQRTETLAKLISIDLACPVSTKSQVQENIDRLLRMGLGDQARDIFLTARTKTIQHRTRHLKFDGDVAAYLSDLAEVTFRLIRNTCDWYGGSFRDTTMASGFMKWVTGEIIHFTDTLRRQVFDSHQSFSIIADCLSSSLDQCQQLREVGLDLNFIIDKIVFTDIGKAIELHAKSCEELVIQAVESDLYESLEPRLEFLEEHGLTFEIDIPRMSESAYQLFKILTEFASDLGALMSMTLYNKIVASLSSLFNVYIQYTALMLERSLSNTQMCTLLANITFVVKYMLPKVTNQLEEQFERAIPELQEDCIRHESSLEKIKVTFIASCCKNLIKNDYNFEKIDYTNSAAILESTLPSESILKLATSLNKLLSDMDKMLDRKHLEGQVIEYLFKNMISLETCWETDRGPRKFGFGGVQALLLDIHFILRVAELYVTEAANESANTICEKALRAYFVQNKDLGVPLKTGEWYDRRVDDAARKYSKGLRLLISSLDTASKVVTK